MSRGGGAAYVAGRAAGAVGSAGGAAASGARSAYQRVALRGPRLDLSFQPLFNRSNHTGEKRS